jgi:putative transposase
MCIERRHPLLSLRRQCRLLSLSRSALYYTPAGERAENLKLMVLIDQQFLETPWYGSRQMARWLRRQGRAVGRHRVRRLMCQIASKRDPLFASNRDPSGCAGMGLSV